jgi:hypothetical protein
MEIPDNINCLDKKWRVLFKSKLEQMEIAYSNNEVNNGKK